MVLHIEGSWHDKVSKLLEYYGDWDLVKALILQSPNHTQIQKAAMIGAGLQIMCQRSGII